MSRLPDPIRQPEFYDSVPAKRLLAWIIDSFITFVLSALAVVMTAFIGAFFWVFLYFLVGFGYRVVTIAAGSATWGMRFAGIELRDAAGRRLDPGLALAHTAGYTVSMMISPLQVISIVMMLTTARGQGLTDIILGTAMLNRRV